MKKRYCLVGEHSGSILSYQGLALVHDDRAELEYLFPYTRVIELPGYFTEELTMSIKGHPDMATVVFPLASNMGQFRRKRK